jgi:hypothetical protein
MDSNGLIQEIEPYILSNYLYEGDQTKSESKALLAYYRAFAASKMDLKMKQLDINSS